MALKDSLECPWNLRDVLGIGQEGLSSGEKSSAEDQRRILIRAHQPVVGDSLPEMTGGMKRTWGPQPCKGLVGQEWLMNETEAVVLEDSESQDGPGPQRSRELQEAGSSISRAAVTLA